MYNPSKEMKAALPFTISVLLLAGCLTAWAGGEKTYGDATDVLKAFADPNTGLTSFPTLLVPLGGISEGMGTAYAAVSLDSGFIESNPAASSIMDNAEVAFYHHSWIADSNLEGVVYTTRVNDLGIGVGGKFLYVPFTAYNAWGAAGATDYISETVGTLNFSYNFLSDYYFRGLAAGANVKVAYRSIPAVFALNQSALAVMTDVGMRTSFNFLKFYNAQEKNFAVGIVIKNLGFSSLPDETLPQVLTGGFAWSPLRPWTLAVDGNIPFSFPGQPPAAAGSIAVGSTVAIASFLSVQAGFLVSPSNPKVSVGAALDIGTLDLTMNYNLDLSGSLNPLDKFSVQARFLLGDSGRAAAAKKADELYLQGVEAYAAGDLSGAIDLWRQVLAIDPRYTPASDNIKTAQRTLELQGSQGSGAK
jgi:hypothetical protein